MPLDKKNLSGCRSINLGSSSSNNTKGAMVKAMSMLPAMVGAKAAAFDKTPPNLSAKDPKLDLEPIFFVKDLNKFAPVPIA